MGRTDRGGRRERGGGMGWARLRGREEQRNAVHVVDDEVEGGAGEADADVAGVEEEGKRHAA